MKNRIAKLIDVKSIVTFVLTGVFAYLSIIKAIEPKDFLQVFLMVITFYFGTQVGKKEAEDIKKEEDDADK